MSEKPASGPRAGVRIIRVTAVVPLLFCLAAFILTLLTVISGTRPGMLEGAHSMALNTTHLGENIIQFSAASNGSSTSSDPISSFFSSLLGAITSGIDGALNSAEASAVSGVISALGISEYYTFHLRTICEGSLSDPTSSNAKFSISKCSSYEDTTAGLERMANIIPSSTVIGLTNVTVPLLSTVASSAGFLNSLSQGLSTSTFAFFIISLVGAFFAVPASGLAAIRPSSPLLMWTIFISTGLAVTFQFIGAVIVTAFAGGATAVVSKFGNGVGLYANMGIQLQIFVWVSFGLLLLSFSYWLSVWFVEFRQRSYKARRRTSYEIGNWKGIFAEVLSDLRLPKDDDSTAMTTALAPKNLKPAAARNSYGVI
ncbi:hypothetical protein BP5796_09772 [Coleophoma crateriformis]|uniref:Uncharacterized protein n=1 Tax=Coleophoma crateriformis TaxID=565419 RepID=A0A3D8QYW5_9HELO|nr:hypothetical protein BP5796_09772 [Coleophoma crateriformis]